MLRLTFRNLAANKGRFAMTTLAVVLGVGFVVASFVLSDGLRSSFGDLSDEITEGTDLAVRPTSEFGEPAPLDESIVDQVAAIEGVRVAEAFVASDDNAVQPILADRTTIDTNGPPQLTFAWIDDTDVDGIAGESERGLTQDVGSLLNILRGNLMCDVNHGEFPDRAVQHPFHLGDIAVRYTEIGRECNDW